MSAAVGPTGFTEDQVRRYARHVILDGVGAEGQRRLLDASVLVVGAGGLGSPAAMYLAAAGVGRLGVADGDTVDLSNLQRQVIHGTGDLGRPKVVSAGERLADLNPTIDVVEIAETVDATNAMRLLEGWDVVLDATDSFATRYLLNDATHLLGIPLVQGAIHRFEGQVTVFGTGEGDPCYRCLFPEPPAPGAVPTCAEAGVFGVLPGIVGSLQAAEAIKLLVGVGTPLVGRLLVFDALAMRFAEARYERDPACALCGDAPTVTALVDYEAFCGLRAPLE